MNKFHEEMAQFNQQQCAVRHELWPTKDKIVSPYTCSRCRKDKSEVPKFGAENDMVRDLSSIPEDILKHFRELTMVEEMFLSPFIPIMSVYRLPSGGNVSRG